MMFAPEWSLDVVSLAVPRRRPTVLNTLVPSRKSTWPLGAALTGPAIFTVAVRVTGLPRVAGLGFAVSVVRV
jgi:hypothetical protein